MDATNPPENVKNFWMIESRWNWIHRDTGRKKPQLEIQAYLGNTWVLFPDNYSDRVTGTPRQYCGFSSWPQWWREYHDELTIACHDEASTATKRITMNKAYRDEASKYRDEVSEYRDEAKVSRRGQSIAMRQVSQWVDILWWAEHITMSWPTMISQVHSDVQAISRCTERSALSGPCGVEPAVSQWVEHIMISQPYHNERTMLWWVDCIMLSCNWANRIPMNGA